MADKKLLAMAGVAAVLVAAAYVATSGKKGQAPSLSGKSILPSFDVAQLAAIEMDGEKPLALSLGEKGWKVDSLYGYPADISKIRENVLKLKDLKVGQVANSVKIEKPVTVGLKDKEGKTLASVSLGAQHFRKAMGQQAMFGGGSFPDGRYVLFGGKTVLVKDSLSSFDGDPKKWVDTRIASVPASEVEKVSCFAGKENVVLRRDAESWKIDGLKAADEIDSSKLYGVDSVLSYLDFTDIADPSKISSYGFATGAVYVASLKNGISYMANVGDSAGDGKYFRISATFKPAGTNAVENAKLEKIVKEFNAKAANWVYVISSYSAGSMSKKYGDFVKAKDPPKEEKK
jgi:hypothetical protein